MSDEIKAAFSGRLGAWVKLSLYVLLGISTAASAWLATAPAHLGDVSAKQWVELFAALLSAGILQAKSFISQGWGKK